MSSVSRCRVVAAASAWATPRVRVAASRCACRPASRIPNVASATAARTAAAVRTLARNRIGALYGLARDRRDWHDRERMPSPPPLRDAEAHAERLFALSQDLLGAADAEGRLRWVNAAWERLFGWRADELYSRPYLDFVHPDDREKVAAFAQRLAHMPAGESLQVETRACGRDGGIRW